MASFEWPPEGGTGVTSLNGETGDITLIGGTNVTVTPAGQNITISAASPASGNLTDAGTDGIVITGGTGAVLGAGTSIAQHVADSTHNGYLSSTDWSTFNAKQSALTLGNLTDAGTDGITITGGTGSVIGSGTSIAQHVADATHNGYLSSADWNSFSSGVGSAVTSFGSFGSTPNSAGASISGNVATLQPADATNPGGISTTTQTIAGAKTFSSNITAPHFVGSSGDATTPAFTVPTGGGNTGFYFDAGFGSSLVYNGALIANFIASQWQFQKPVNLVFTSNVSTPSLYFNNEPTTGFYRIGANNTGYTVSGSKVLDISSTGLGVTGTMAATGAVSGSNLSGTNTGDVTLTAVGSTPGANGASLSGQALTLQPADGTNPGLVTAGAQTIGGAKTFSGAISASNLSGTNTGDVTIGTANGLSLSGQALSLQAATTSLTGALTSTDWNTFNGKQASGNYLTALTGDGTAAGPGSAALALATVNANTGSFGSSTAIPNFTVNGKGLITAAGTNAVIAPAGTLTGTTLASNVVTSSLTTVGTIGTGTWAGTAVAVNHGGTGQTSYTDGQLLIGNTSGNTLTKSTLTAGSNVTITNGNGSITIAATGGSSNTNKIFYTNTTITSSITSATDTRCQYNTSVYDPNSLVTTGGSWVFTAAATAFHAMTAGVIVSGTFTGGQTYRIGIFVNGSEVMRNIYRPQNSETNALGLQVSGGYQLTVGDTVYAAVNCTGSGFTFVNIASVMYISISQG